MAKVSFKNLGLKVNQETNKIEFNGQTIEVKQYLPLQEKLDLITKVTNQSEDEGTNFANPMQIKVWTTIEIVLYYTNLNITDKQQEDFVKLYDMLISSGLYQAVYQSIPAEELMDLNNSILKTVENFYQYRNSALGILDAIGKSNSISNTDLEQIQSILKEAEGLDTLKSILPFLEK